MIKKSLLLCAGLLAGVASFGQKSKDLLIQMIFVKGGNFYMGYDDPQFHSAEYDNERPVHRVHVSDFYIGKYEVTLGQWKKVMGVYPAAYNGVDYANKDCDDCPVVKVNWDDVQEFIKRLNEKYPGKNYRLPSETEWEFAARGGKYSKKYLYSGSDKLSMVGWYGKKNSAAHPVGQKQPNEIGIYDLAGNVAEWCADWYDEGYYSTTTDATDPKGPKTGQFRIARGGSYYDDDAMCRSVNRGRYLPETRQWNLGFRLAFDPPAGSKPEEPAKTN